MPAAFYGRMIRISYVDLRMRIVFAADLRPSRVIFLADKPIGKEMARSRDIYASPFV